MSKESRSLSSRCRLACIAVWLLFAGRAAAGDVPAPVITVEDANSYTVTYTPCSECPAHGIEESVGSAGEWNFLASEPVSFSARSPGTYRYRVVYARLSASMQYEPLYSAPVTVVIDTEAGPSVGTDLVTQLGRSFDAYRADLDVDGRDEVLLRTNAAAQAGQEMPAGVLIDADAGGNAIATPVDWATVGALAPWRDAGLEVLVRDVDVDGFADLLLRGVSHEDGLAVDDNLIVFAPGATAASGPLAVRSIDSSLARFAADMQPHLIDPEYYPQNAPLRYARFVYYTLNCTDYRSYYSPDDWIGLVLPWPCFFEPYYYYYTYRDYSVFDADAMYVASHDYGMIHGIVPVDMGMERIRSLLARILGRELGGWDVNELLGGNSAVEDERERSGLDLFVILAGISDAVAQEADVADGSGGQDRVLIKGRRVLGRGPLHSALEYQYSTLSAYDSDPSIIADGRLVSEVNWPRDNPALTMRLGYVDGPVGAATYWSGLLQADSRYGDDLPYDLFPSIGLGGYNSNSFTSGLIDATLGEPTISMATLVGGERPVPASEFR